MDQRSGSEFTCCCVVSTFRMKLLGFVSKVIKLLLTELVGQCRNILPSLRSVNTEKAAGNRGGGGTQAFF